MARRSVGFTLIEVMLALTMVGTVLLLAYTSLSTTTRTIQSREAHAKALHRGNFILRHLTDQLQSAYLDQAAYYRLTDPSELFEGGGDALAFWTYAPPQTRRASAGVLQRVEYRLRPAETGVATGDGEEPGFELECAAYADLGLVRDEPIARWAIPVDAVAFEYHDGEQWTGGWDIGTEERLPHAIRITVTVKGADDTPLELSTVVPLHVTARTELEPPEATAGGVGAGGEGTEDTDGTGTTSDFNPFGDPGYTPPRRDPIAAALGNG